MKTLFYHLFLELKIGWRDRTQLLMLYLFPLGFYVFLGLLMTELNPDFRRTMLFVMPIFTVLTGMVLGLPSQLVSTRESGVFRSYKINGLPLASVLFIPVLATGLHLLIGALIMLVTAPMFFQAQVPLDWWGFILPFLLMVFTCAGLGTLISVISSSAQATILWSQLIFLPSMLIGGLMLPSEILPYSLRKLGMLLPSAYGINIFKGLALKEAVAFSPAWSILILAAGGVLAFALSFLLFSWDNIHRAGRRSHFLALGFLFPFLLGMIFLI